MSNELLREHAPVRELPTSVPVSWEEKERVTSELNGRLARVANGYVAPARSAKARNGPAELVAVPGNAGKWKFFGWVEQSPDWCETAVRCQTATASG
jgi:hypothetical protein